jgi:hypothetical protein
MPISDKSRKVLWGRSGNRCAICKRALVVEATKFDDESVVGDECHTISSSDKGPRHDPAYPQEKQDAYENLLLLCRVHHKMVDDQEQTYTIDILRQMKTNHEIWVREKLTDSSSRPKPIKFIRVKENVPAFLSRLTSGKQILDLVAGTYAYSMNHDDLQTQEEVDLVGGFLQTVQDWGDLSSDLEVGARVEAAFSLTQLLNKIEDAGFFVFGGREVQVMEGGIQAEPSNWPISIFIVLRKTNDQIIPVDFGTLHR